MSPRATAMLGALALAFTAMPVAIAVSAANPQRARACQAPRSAKILARGPRLVMWLARHTRRRATTPPEWESTETYAACVPPRGRTRVIGYLNEEAPVQCGSSIALKYAGSFAATVSSVGCSSGSLERLTLHDVLRDHATQVITYSQLIYTRPDPPELLQSLGPPFGLTINRFALDARGDIAWSGSNYAQPGEVSLDVLYLRDAAGTRRVAAAPSIGRVAFAGDELTWRAFGSAHSVAGG